MDNVELPDLFEDVCQTHKQELLESFLTYWGESCLETYVRSIYEWDYEGMEEILTENDKFIEDFLMDRLQDTF